MGHTGHKVRCDTWSPSPLEVTRLRFLLNAPLSIMRNIVLRLYRDSTTANQGRDRAR